MYEENAKKKTICRRFHQDNGGVDLVSDCDWLEARFEETFDGNENFQVCFRTRPSLLS